MVNHRRGIISPESSLGFPWAVDQVCWQIAEFRNPFPHISSIGIKLFALQDRIEDAEMLVVKAGANVLVAGSAIFKGADHAASIKALRQAASSISA